MSPREQYDVIVVGFGAAGAAAAIEAADHGARVLVLDRGYGGGATALSGGILYAGGGTQEQVEGGYADSAENMQAYLRAEVGDAVPDETLQQFCAGSTAMVSWLKQQGVPFRGGQVPAYKTSYPTDKHYLYYSGNEKAHPYLQAAEPAPRGHRVLAPGMASGRVLFEKLSASARSKGVDFVPLARVHGLIIEQGRVVGVRYRCMESTGPAARRHARLTKLTGKVGTWMPDLVKGPVGRIDKIWSKSATEHEVRSPTVILATGGFIYNREWVAQYAPQFTKISPLGTPGDDGSGIALGLQAGGMTDKMGNVTAWRFLSPTSAFIEGLTVGDDGRRIKNEDLYGATHGNILMREHGGRGFAIYDARTWRKAMAQVREQTKMFQRLQLVYLFTIGHRKARSIEELAQKNGVDPAGLRVTVDAYNSGLASGVGDPAHKATDLCSPIDTGPFYSINISVDSSKFYPIPGLTLGGLVVDQQTGEVLRKGGGTVQGLYAVGRTAVGICSNGYISGLSLADCIFSGRRAGAAAAPAAEPRRRASR